MSATARALSDDAAEVLATERDLVLGLGGLSIGFAGGTLTLHERIPVPRFNFAVVDRLGRERHAEFFERALDQYFQRALRPEFRVPRPVPEHLDAALRRFGFRPRAAPADVLLSNAGGRRAGLASPLPITVDPEAPSEAIARRWVGSREVPELATALDRLRFHPNPGEVTVPVEIRAGDRTVASALVYRRNGSAVLFGVSVDPASRGQGHASALTAGILAARPAGPARYGMISDLPRLTERAAHWGLSCVGSMTVYLLPPEARLELPAPGPPGPPLWRPPRRPGGSPPA
ncbi:MAG: hypothetical protein QXG65_05465 [Thermoplasmata archaeon]